jgi:hypothetical protein
MFGGIIGTSLAIGFSGYDYYTRKQEGESTASAMTKAGAAFVGWQVAAPVMLGLAVRDMAPQLYEAGQIIGRQNRGYVSNQYKANFGGHYVDSQGAATMRQAGLSTISQSRQNSVQGGLGSEAKSYFRRS